jgi:release factor glutamine methyltransferase
LGERQANVLDIGTGSGCIAISVAYYQRQCRVVATDISAEALKVAALNADNAGVTDRVELVNSNLFKNLAGRKFDVILSNPPYIPTGDIHKLDPEVRSYEPFKALDGGADGLDAIRSIIDEAPAFLNKGGLLAIEIGIGQSEDVRKIMKDSFENIEIIKDLQRIPRVLVGRIRKN